MIDTLLSVIAPHPCCSCGRIGRVLCDYCKYDISDEDFNVCVACGVRLSKNGICKQCHVPYVKAWCVGEHAEALHRLIGLYKFDRVRSAYKPLAELLLARISELPAETVIVPVPTVPSHIRVRGYDHTYLLAKYLARKRHLHLRSFVVRLTTTKQRDAGRAQRIAQAKRAFAVRGVLDPDVPYLLIDDVVTTGAPLYYAAKALHDAGAREIWIAAIARQPID